MSKRYTAAILRDWIKTILETGKGLSSWETEFVDSMNEWLETNDTYSEKQEEILERIYATRTN